VNKYSRKNRRWGALLALLVVTALVVAACGGEQPQPTAVPAAGDAAAGDAAAGTETTSEDAAAGEATAVSEEAPAEAAVQATPAPTVPPPAEVAEGAASAMAPAERADMYTEAPELTIDPAKFYYATLATGKGDIKVQLFADRAPETVNNFVFLAREGYYNDTVFHRVIEGFMAQAGDPTGTGMGGPGYQFGDEIWPGATFDRPGLLAMANAGPGTNGSQFFITFGPTDWLDGQHTIFGEVIEGQEVLAAINRAEPGSGVDPDLLYTVLIEESESSTLPTPTPLPPTPTPFAPSSDLGADKPLAALGLEERAGYFNTAPENTLDTTKGYTATITTSQGDLVVALYDDVAPVAVNNFVTLAELGYYDGTPINDVSPGELIVLGSPTGDPSADVGYTIKPEVSLPISPTVGSVAYRSLGQDPEDASIVASGSQLYLAVLAPPADVNVSYSFFGQIVEGLDILPSLTVSDTIESVTVEIK
jgi:cyclophilin family peptidyl-prolyl cis-trans isomerase